MKSCPQHSPASARTDRRLRKHSPPGHHPARLLVLAILYLHWPVYSFELPQPPPLLLQQLWATQPCQIAQDSRHTTQASVRLRQDRGSRLDNKCAQNISWVLCADCKPEADATQRRNWPTVSQFG